MRSYRDYRTNTYRLFYGEEAEVEIGANTLTAYNLSVNDLKDAVLRQDVTDDNKQARAAVEKKINQFGNAQLLKSATAIIKKLYGIELKGYSVSKKAGLVFFVKKGAPTIYASFNSSGALYSLGLEPIAKKWD
jgi:hypothetical protein